MSDNEFTTKQATNRVADDLVLFDNQLFLLFYGNRKSPSRIPIALATSLASGRTIAGMHYRRETKDENAVLNWRVEHAYIAEKILLAEVGDFQYGLVALSIDELGIVDRAFAR